MSFNDYKDSGICDVCGKKGDIVVCASTMGPISFGYCEKCFTEKLEPYEVMVSYIASAGKFPEEINEEYKRLCRNILKSLNIPEDKFISDVNKAIEEIDSYYEQLDNDKGY